MRPVFTERQLGMAGSFADLGFLEGGVFGNPSERSGRGEHWGVWAYGRMKFQRL